MPPQGSPLSDAGRGEPPSSTCVASPPRFAPFGAPAGSPTSGRVTVSAAPAGPPRTCSRGGGSGRPRWGRGLLWRGAAAPCYCLPGIPRLLPSGAAPSPPRARPLGRRHSAGGEEEAAAIRPGRAGPGRAGSGRAAPRWCLQTHPGNAGRTAH